MTIDRRLFFDPTVGGSTATTLQIVHPSMDDRFVLEAPSFAANAAPAMAQPIIASAA